VFSVYTSGDIAGIAWAPRTIPNGNFLFTLLCDLDLIETWLGCSGNKMAYVFWIFLVSKPVTRAYWYTYDLIADVLCVVLTRIVSIGKSFYLVLWCKIPSPNMHFGCLNQTLFIPSGGAPAFLLATCGEDKKVKLWLAPEVSSTWESRSYPGHPLQGSFPKGTKKQRDPNFY
jgi:hypothetical protein